jgi:hypothetical protein
MRPRSLSVRCDPIRLRESLAHFNRHVRQRFVLLSRLTDAAKPHVSWAMDAFSATVPRNETRHAHPRPAALLVYPSIPDNSVADGIPPLRTAHQSLHPPRFPSTRKCALPRAHPWGCQSSAGRSPLLALHFIALKTTAILVASCNICAAIYTPCLDRAALKHTPTRDRPARKSVIQSFCPK